MNSVDSQKQRLPLLDHLRAQRPHTRVTQLLIAANLLIFVAMLFHGAGLWHSPNTVQLAWGANFGPATKDGEWWRLASALFLHFGLIHLAMNMLALWEGGMFVERMYGPARFAAIYAASGLSGNLLSLAVQGDHAVAGGASGAIFGLYGALLIYLWRLRRQLDATEFRWLFWGAAAFSAITICFGMLIPGIDNAAHIGGFFGGCLMGVVLLSSPVPAITAPIYSRITAGIVLGLGLALLVRAIPVPAYRWSEEMQARNGISRFLGEDQQISARWQRILTQGRADGVSFEQLAGEVDTQVAEKYQQTFEELASLKLDPSAPSAQSLATLQRYAALRREASRHLSEGLRRHDRKRIQDALDMARQAPQLAKDPANQGAAPRVNR
jgi:rhomboid protease GluP